MFRMTQGLVAFAWALIRRTLTYRPLGGRHPLTQNNGRSKFILSCVRKTLLVAVVYLAAGYSYWGAVFVNGGGWKASYWSLGW